MIILVRFNIVKNRLDKTQIKQIIKEKEKPIHNKINNYVTEDLMPDYLSYEINRLYLKEINIKRTFEKRFPLSKEIDCKSHMTKNELYNLFLEFENQPILLVHTLNVKKNNNYS